MGKGNAGRSEAIQLSKTGHAFEAGATRDFKVGHPDYPISELAMPAKTPRLDVAEFDFQLYTYTAVDSSSRPLPPRNTPDGERNSISK